VLRHVVLLAAATFAVAAAGVLVPAPAQASTCGAGSGVSVVVDFHQLGGGVTSFCDATGAGESADAQFEDAGHELTYVDQEAFVCRVDRKGSAQCAHTPPADAYWSLWWSDGKSGTWQYASSGVTSLEVPDGGSVALSWQGQSSQAKPRVSPPTSRTGGPSSSPSPHPTSSPHPSTAPGPRSSAPTAAGSPIGTLTSVPAKSGWHRKHHLDASKAGHGPGKSSVGPDRTQAAGPTDQVTGTGDSTGDGGSDGLPGWVAPVAIAVLFLGAGAIALLRRKRSGGA
jgi:hypothetical protein